MDGSNDWRFISLGDGTSANISASGGTITIKQQADPTGPQDTIVLSAAQLRQLAAALDEHQAGAGPALRVGCV